jgi:hypothetical protein
MDGDVDACGCASGGMQQPAAGTSLVLRSFLCIFFFLFLLSFSRSFPSSFHVAAVRTLR